MKYATPESCGVSSASITKMIDALESNRLSTHDLIIARGDNIIFEKYWKPFDEKFLHRQYSVSKSIVTLAVGFALQDGLFSLDEPIEKYFADKMTEKTNELQRKQTIRDMLMMSTALPCKDWFSARTDDRVRFYFENDFEPAVEGGTIFKYDSTGTFVIGALVERLTGMKFMDYLRGKLFEKIGVSSEAHCLECPGGHSWSDSAVLCTAQDLLKIARFTLNYGEWEGEQLLDRQFLVDATSALVQNDHINENMHSTQGYGYYIWRTYENSFSFNGMGSQFALCVPDKDMILIIHSDNQGRADDAKRVIFDSFFDIVHSAKDVPIEVNLEDVIKLRERTSGLKLASAVGATYSPFAEQLNGKTFKFGENRMGIKTAQFVFNENGGCIYYENEQGKKKIAFGMGCNVFGEFEQDGYSDVVGSQKGERRYKCAASAIWMSEKSLLLKVQIIDTYFGNFHALFSFKNNTVSLQSEKYAEDFLCEYYGRAFGTEN